MSIRITVALNESHFERSRLSENPWWNCLFKSLLVKPHPIEQLSYRRRDCCELLGLLVNTR